jgi:exodeoxyribonuclease V alpha subunit
LAKPAVNQESSTVRGVVQAIFHAGANFSAGRLRTDDGESVRFAGKVFVRENDPVSLRGRWEDHPKYGRQFSVDWLDAQVELDPAGLANYLANHPDITGIGPVKAKLIADAFGRKFDEIIRHTPRAVATVAKVPMDAVQNLQRIWIETSGVNAAMTYLASYGLTHFQVTTLVEKFENHVVPMLQEDPYILISEVPGFGFKRVDKIARRLGTPKELPSRLQAGIRFTIQSALDDGDCWVEYEDLLDRANALLVLDNLDSRELIERQLEVLIGAKQLVCCPYDRLVVADPMIHEMEEFLAGVFRKAWARNPNGTDVIPGHVYFNGPLNEDQRAAATNAFKFSISLMTGGAGSGKTFTIDSLIAACEDLGLSYELAAPTGKAAKRLEQSVKRPAKTVHRLLVFNGHTFAKGPDDKLEADFLVVDEVSMVDVPLMYRLFRALDLNRTAVLLVGDHNQLPPVGPGNVLRDLVQSNAIPTTVLRKIIRQAGVLKENSTAILDGEVRPTCDEKVDGYRPWYVVNNFTDREHVRLFLEKLFHEVLAERLGFDLLQDVQVLTPIHKGPLGTVEINIILQRLIQKKLFGVDAPDVEPGRRPEFLPGDKVIQTKNDYDLGVMNGAVGYIVANHPKDGMTVDFEGHLVEIPRDSAKEYNIQLAYATSIHKMQGSEFPCAIVITHKSHSFMHHRNLLYTAVTRAQKSVIMLGDHWGIENCAKKQQVDKRNTFLSFLLHDARRQE